MNQENREGDISDVQGAVARLFEKARSFSERMSELEKEARQISDLKANSDVRLRILESDLRRLSDDFSEMDRKVRMFELNHDSRKEKWNTAINFIIQLVWVSMAAFLLSKLGLQAPL